MKFHGKSMAVTISLIIVLFLVLLLGVSLFVSGPARSYEDKIAKQEAQIKEANTAIKDLDRHAFKYITYVGKDDSSILWFNESAELIVKKDSSTLQEQKALETAKKAHRFEEATVNLGYGYNNPVYVVTSKDCIVLLDYDTLEEVYYRNKDVIE